VDQSTGLINWWIGVDIWIGVVTISHHTWDHEFSVDVCLGLFLTTYGTISQWSFFSTSRKSVVDRAYVHVVRVCVYMCMYVCVLTCIYVHICMCIFICIRVHVYTCTCVYVYTYLCIDCESLQLFSSVFGRCHRCACVFLWICMRMHICVCIYMRQCIVLQ